MKEVKVVNRETLYSSKMIAMECGKKHFHVVRDITVTMRKLKNPNLGSSINLDSYVVLEEKYKSGKTTKQYWMNRKAVELITTGYDVVRRAKLLDKLEELYNENKKLKEGLSILAFATPRAITSRELLLTDLFKAHNGHYWWQSALSKRRSSLTITGQLTVFLQLLGVKKIDLMETNEMNKDGDVIKRKSFDRLDVFNKVQRALPKMFVMEEGVQEIFDRVLGQFSYELEISNLINSTGDLEPVVEALKPKV